MVVCVLVIACFVKIATCNPCSSSTTNNKYPTMTTSYATNIAPGENKDFIWDIPLHNSYIYPDISRPMAITPLSIPMDSRTNAYVPEFNVANDYYAFNGYTPRIGASQTNSNFLDHPIYPRFTNDIQTPKYQYKPFSETFNTFRDNICKANELNFRSTPFYSLENSKSIDDLNYSEIYDFYDHQSSPLKVLLNPQESYSEFPICKPYINYNTNICQNKFDGQENIANINDVAASGPLELTNILFFNTGTSALDNGNFLEEEIQMSSTPYYNKCNPFNSNILNQQFLPNNQMLQENKLTKPDQDNLARINIDINIPNNNFNEKNIPIEIKIVDTYDDLIDESIEEEAPSIIIDIYDKKIDLNNDCNNSNQFQENNTNINLNKPNYLELNVTKAVNTKNCANSSTSTPYENSKSRCSLNEFSSYLAETILSALQSFLTQEPYSDMNNCCSNNLLNVICEEPTDCNDPPLSFKPFILSQPLHVCPFSNPNLTKVNETETRPADTEKDLNLPSNVNDSFTSPYQTPQISFSTKRVDNSTKESPLIYNNSNCLKNNSESLVTANNINNISETSLANTADNNSKPPSTAIIIKKPETSSVNSTDRSVIPSDNSTDNKPIYCASNTIDNKTVTFASNSTGQTITSSNNTTDKPKISTNNSTDISLAKRTNNITKICTINRTGNINENSAATDTNNTVKPEIYSSNDRGDNSDKISEASSISSIQSLLLNDTSCIENNIDKISESEKCYSTKAQPRLSTITINITPTQENNHHILVFV